MLVLLLLVGDLVVSHRSSCMLSARAGLLDVVQVDPGMVVVPVTVSWWSSLSRCQLYHEALDMEGCTRAMGNASQPAYSAGVYNLL